MEFFVNNAWLIPGLPIMAAIFIGIFGKWLKGAAHWPAVLSLVASAVMSVGLLVGLSNGGIKASSYYPLPDVGWKALTPYRAVIPGEPAEIRKEVHAGEAAQHAHAEPVNTIVVPVYQWFATGDLKVDVMMYIDQLTAIYMAFVTVVGSLIFMYASGYMKGDYGYWRFFAYFCLFVFAMACLVMGGNFILLYLGWEGVGVASYLLIGYYYPRPSAVAAAKKAFITNRIGDFGFAIGIFLIYWIFGSFNYAEVFARLGDQAFIDGLTSVKREAIYWIPFCLMVGAFGKSAQFPLHVWLPDAMEGPTPVSALIHAATMVTAGIYMIARTMLFFHPNVNGEALIVVGAIGGITAFLAASIAFCTYDLKRVWAYSTLSQLGYMFMGLGVAATSSAVFHVFTHAWFKALLFLAAGSVMHAMGGELDLRKMSGIRKYMPKTMVLMLIGCFALAGVPGFAGFFSKDEILYEALNSGTTHGTILGVLGLVVALMTAYYTFRLFFRVFMGPVVLPATAGHHEPSPFALAEDHAPGHHGHAGVDTMHAKQGHEESSHGADNVGQHGHAGHHVHEPNDGPISMWGPLVLLAVGAFGAGYLGFDPIGHHPWFQGFLSTLPGFGHHPPAGSKIVSHNMMMVISGIIALVGIAIAWYFHLKNRHAADIVGANFRPVVKFLENRWYIDQLYGVIITKALWVFSHILSIIDRFIVDGVVFLVGFAPQLVGYTLKPTQRGMLQRYAVGMVAGIAAIIAGVIWVLS